jgi:hypothetical protein
LETCISVSQSRKFPLVDFIDTPGLVDGNVDYPFDVKECIKYLATHADLIMVFLDPMTQALCSRTMDVVQALSKENGDKMMYIMTKIDTIPKKGDLHKVLVQIIQNLFMHIPPQHGLDVPTIFIPQDGQDPEDAPNSENNQLSNVCDDISKALMQKVQDNLKSLEGHCKEIQETAVLEMQKEKENQVKRLSNKKMSMYFSVVAWMFPCISFFFVLAAFDELLPSDVTSNEYAVPFLAVVNGIFEPLILLLPSDLTGRAKFMGGIVVVFSTLLFLAGIFKSRAEAIKVRTEAEMARLKSHGPDMERILAARNKMQQQYIDVFAKKDFSEE